MARQRNDKPGEEISQDKAYGQAKPINDRLAAILVIVSAICSLVATWGGYENHHTTMNAAIIVGVLCLMFAVYFHLTPNKARAGSAPPRPISIEIANPEPPKLQAPSADLLLEAPKRDVEVSKPFTDPKTGAVQTIPFDAGPPPWKDYTQAKLHGVFWRWHYTLEFDDEPHGLVPYCPECPRRLAVSGPQRNPNSTNDFEFFAFASCPCHRGVYMIPVDVWGGFTLIKADIQRMRRDGSWEGVFSRPEISN